MATCSWKAALKGRPPPCDGLRRPGLLGGDRGALAYWGPNAEPRGVGLPAHQRAVAKKQPRGENLMGSTISAFFRDVFGVAPGVDPSAWASASTGDPALPWSNYFAARPAVWRSLAEFDLVASAWLDGKFPRAAANASSAACPAAYAGLRERGILSTDAVDENCRYCRNAAFTNSRRCRVGCHRCWSYVLEQMNVIFFRVLADLRYVHDEAACAAPRTWAPPAVEGRGDFDVAFLRDVYRELARE